MTIPAEAPRGVMRVSSAATCLPPAVIKHPGQLAGPARDLAAYRRADLLGTAIGGLGQVVDFFV